VENFSAAFFEKPGKRLQHWKNKEPAAFRTAGSKMWKMWKSPLENPRKTAES
jgi:hypothetical protein